MNYRVASDSEEDGALSTSVYLESSEGGVLGGPEGSTGDGVSAGG